nr:exosortase F system-associated protein [Flavobacterium sp. A45]
MLFVTLLVFVRAFEKQLFYDPFLVYFEGDYMELPLPEFDNLKLFFGLTFRFFLNALFSLGILYFIFKDKEMISFVSILYLFLFVILIAAFFCMLHFFKNQENLLLFYVRRFLIQPLFVIVFIPAFYYQKLNN